VQREEIQEVANRYLRPENRAIVFRAPVSKEAKEAA
jgi:predicted Zn-dependent peptidase